MYTTPSESAQVASGTHAAALISALGACLVVHNPEAVMADVRHRKDVYGPMESGSQILHEGYIIGCLP